MKIFNCGIEEIYVVYYYCLTVATYNRGNGILQESL